MQHIFIRTVFAHIELFSLFPLYELPPIAVVFLCYGTVVTGEVALGVRGEEAHARRRNEYPEVTCHRIFLFFCALLCYYVEEV